MEFKEASKYGVIALAAIGVAGLLFQIFSVGRLGFGSSIALEDDFGRLNSSRLFLIIWETFWLSSIAIFFIFVARRAKSGKAEDQIKKLEDFEPLLFKVVIGGLFLAALLTLLLPAFVGENTLVHYNQNDDGEEILVTARQFQFAVQMEGGNLTTCAISDAPADSCFTVKVDTRYVFVLESGDTTHGFTIYDDNNVLLTQAQIVPEYQTRLAFTFDSAGDYSIRCSEYCGAAHHTMLASFTVEA